MALLITGGTRKFAPLRNALCALHRKLGFDIEAIWLVDNEETARYFCDNVEKIKETLGKRDIMVASLEVREDDAFEKIPNFMSRFVLRDVSKRDDIIVDLTAGPKFITSLLYAAANFCRINHIYYFLLKGEKRRVPFEELGDADYEYLRLPPFSSESLYNLTRRSYLELIFYMKEVEDLVSDYSCEAPNLAEKIDQSLRFAVRDYFEGDYAGSIRSIGGLLEMWAEHLYRFWEGQGALSRYSPPIECTMPKGSWAFHTCMMRGLFSKLQKVKEGDQIEGLDERLVKDALQIATVNDLLEVVRPFRNLASHKADLGYQLTKEDAKLVLDIALNIVKKSKGTVFFAEKEEEKP